MLANNLTVEDEESVQAELLELQREAVRHVAFLINALVLTWGLRSGNRNQKDLSSCLLRPQNSRRVSILLSRVCLQIAHCLKQRWKNCLQSGNTSQSASVYLSQLEIFPWPLIRVVCIPGIL